MLGAGCFGGRELPPQSACEGCGTSTLPNPLLDTRTVLCGRTGALWQVENYPELLSKVVFDNVSQAAGLEPATR